MRISSKNNWIPANPFDRLRAGPPAIPASPSVASAKEGESGNPVRGLDDQVGDDNVKAGRTRAQGGHVAKRHAFYCGRTLAVKLKFVLSWLVKCVIFY